MDDIQRAALAAELAKPEYADMMAAQRYTEIAAALNARPLIDNPTPRPNRPKLITWNEFMKALTDADGLKLYSYGSLAADMKAALANNDRAMAQDLWRSLATVLTATSKTNVQAAFQQTEPDPTYQTKIPGASVADTLGWKVLPRDVQAVDTEKAAQA